MGKEKFDVIIDPKENEIKLAVKSALVSRIRGSKDDEFMTAVIRLFKINNPHKTQEFPLVVYKFTNMEKVRVRRLNVSYYLEGNDVVINDLDEIFLIQDGSKLTIKGYQVELESRRK